jgi:hypothetical protein
MKALVPQVEKVRGSSVPKTFAGTVFKTARNTKIGNMPNINPSPSDKAKMAAVTPESFTVSGLKRESLVNYSQRMVEPRSTTHVKYNINKTKSKYYHKGKCYVLSRWTKGMCCHENCVIYNLRVEYV